MLVTTCSQQLILPTTGVACLPTDLHALFGEPEGQAVTMEVLLALPVDFKLHLELPVPQVAGLRSRQQRNGLNRLFGFGSLG